MLVVPVLDVMKGEVVRGVGGRRDEYRPIVSRLTASSRPRDVASALAAHFGFREFYLADLDAILGAEPAWQLYDVLHECGFRLWVDAGIRQFDQACRLADANIECVVAGLETVTGPAELAQIAQAFRERLVFSLDLHQGEPLGEQGAWQGQDAEGIAAQAIQLGVRRLLVLDLARVGCDGGTGTRELCARLSANYPHISVSAGGGIRHRADLERLRDDGVQAVLVASALHEGRLTRTDLDGLGRTPFAGR